MVRLSMAVLCAAACLQAHDPVSTNLTWTQEISRIVYKRCSGCHSSGGSAPMSLTQYSEARPWAKAIKEEVLQRRMPPWGAVKGFGDFRDDASLTQDEITRIAEWVEGGAPEGDPAYLPSMPAKLAKPSIPDGRRTRAIRGRIQLLAIHPLNSIPSVQVVANLPDGSKIPLLWLREYKRVWSRTFVYREPISLPAGTRISAYPQFPFELIVTPISRATRAR